MFICSLIFLFFLSTFLSTSDNLNKFWMLGYWASPLMYAQNAIATNEFTAHQWIKVLILPADENFLILPQNKAELTKFSFAFADTSWINRVTRNNCPKISWAIFWTKLVLDWLRCTSWVYISLQWPLHCSFCALQMCVHISFMCCILCWLVCSLT